MGLKVSLGASRCTGVCRAPGVKWGLSAFLVQVMQISFGIYQGSNRSCTWAALGGGRS